MSVPLPYCGAPPSPGELGERFNLDPALIGVLLLLSLLHLYVSRNRRSWPYAALGWFAAALALISPLCALSVALFSARIAQHMILLLVAAPLIALGLPSPTRLRGDALLFAAAIVFFLSLWAWHMPAPYDATFHSTFLYWAMHCTLFGSGVLLWATLLQHAPERTPQVLIAGLLTSMQMGLLGAVLTLAGRPLFFPHLITAPVWGLTPLQDQQLGGTLMWVPGMALFLWVAIRSLRRLWGALDGLKAT